MTKNELVTETVTRNANIAYCDACKHRIEPGPCKDGKFQSAERYAVLTFEEGKAGSHDTNQQVKHVCRPCLKAKFLPLFKALAINTELVK